MNKINQSVFAAPLRSSNYPKYSSDIAVATELLKYNLICTSDTSQPNIGNQILRTVKLHSLNKNFVIATIQVAYIIFRDILNCFGIKSDIQKTNNYFAYWCAQETSCTPNEIQNLRNVINKLKKNHVDCPELNSELKKCKRTKKNATTLQKTS